MKFAFIGVQLSRQQAQLERWNAGALCRIVGVARAVTWRGAGGRASRQRRTNKKSSKPRRGCA